MKKKILIIPSWYPVRGSLSGIFFKDQAFLLATNFDITVLYGIPILFGVKKINNSLLSIKKRITIIEDNHINKENTNLREIIFTYKKFHHKKIRDNYKIDYKVFLNIINNYNLSFDLIHIQGTFDACFVGNLLKNKLNIPNIITEHSPINIADIDYKKINLFLSSLQNANCITTVSEHSRRIILDILKNKNVINHGNYLNENYYEFNDKKNVELDVLNLLWIGRLYYGKDPITFIKVLNQLKIKEVSFKAIMVFGSYNGEIRIETIKELILKYNLNDNVEILFDLSKDEIRNVYKKSDILISTSMNETFGLVVAEAILSGINVIATNSGGVQDIIINGENGYIVDIKDYKSIVDCVFNIMNKYKDFDYQKNRQNIINKFGSNSFRNNVTNIYNNVINSASSL